VTRRSTLTTDPAPMAGLRIVLLCIAAAIVYGVVHDQVTARICIE
jgi:hypothetical protein